jgi:TetR/AcrR family transcriptional regulator, transcriptional repressor for nem operon
MPGSRKRREKVLEKILHSATRLFNRHGFNAVSIDDVMAEAGLTRGSFYSYFSSKSDLYAQSVARVVCEKRDAANGHHGNGRFSAGQIVRGYLSAQHFEDIDGSCPMIGLPSDISRTDPSVRQAFESALRLMVEIFEQDLTGRAKADGRRGLAIAALCVGGMVLARSVEDRKLADELRQAALAAALLLGEWA